MEKKLSLIQTFRRLSQKLGNSGWSLMGKHQDAQVKVLQQLYERHGLDLVMTCGACPEQYDVFKDGKQVAYYRLRHGTFRVDYPDCGGETIYMVDPNGDGIFEPEERFKYMSIAMRIVTERIKKDENGQSNIDKAGI